MCFLSVDFPLQATICFAEDRVENCILPRPSIPSPVETPRSLGQCDAAKEERGLFRNPRIHAELCLSQGNTKNEATVGALGATASH